MTTALMMVVHPVDTTTLLFSLAMFLPLVAGLLLHTGQTWTSDPRTRRVLGAVAVAAVLAVGGSELSQTSTDFMVMCTWWWC